MFSRGRISGFAAAALLFAAPLVAQDDTSRRPRRPDFDQREAALEAARPKPPATPAPRTVIDMSVPQPPGVTYSSGPANPTYAAPATPIPAPGPTRADMQPAARPSVTLNNGLLTIEALNSTLADVLHAVRIATNARFEGPLTSGTERVFVRVGPLPPAEALARLLQGSRFDYMILGRSGMPGSVARVVLTHRTVSAASSSAPVQPQRTPAVVQSPAEEDMPDEDEEFPNEGIAPAPDMPEVPRPPGVGPPQNPATVPPQGPNVNPGTNPQNPNDPNRVRSPEELLEELQRMQQQQLNQQNPDRNPNVNQDSLGPADRPPDPRPPL